MELTSKLRPAHPYVGNQVKQFAGIEYRTLVSAAVIACEHHGLKNDGKGFKIYQVHNEKICGREWPCVLLLSHTDDGESLAICLDGETKEAAAHTSAGLNNCVASSWIQAIEHEIDEDLHRVHA